MRRAIQHDRDGRASVGERPDRSTGCFELLHEVFEPRPRRVFTGSTLARLDPITTMLCGAVLFEHPAAARLVAHLPNVLVVNATSSPHAEWLESTLRLLAVEATALRPGGETIITRLADILVIQAIRSWLDHDPAAHTGWVGALRDSQIGRALTLIHRAPAHPWTVAGLAGEVAMSRSAFAARFTELVGEPVIRYLARWRMHVAVTWLQDEDAPIAELASRLGYESEAAFSRAFKRTVGEWPGAIRRRSHRVRPAPDSVATPVRRSPVMGSARGTRPRHPRSA